jgi:hypothetical protein
MASFCCLSAGVFVPGAAVGTCPSKHLRMPSLRCRSTGPLAPGAAVGPRPLKHFQVAFFCCLNTGPAIDPRPLEHPQVASPCIRGCAPSTPINLLETDIEYGECRFPALNTHRLRQGSCGLIGIRIRIRAKIRLRAAISTCPVGHVTAGRVVGTLVPWATVGTQPLEHGRRFRGAEDPPPEDVDGGISHQRSWKPSERRRRKKKQLPRAAAEKGESEEEAWQRKVKRTPLSAPRLRLAR